MSYSRWGRNSNWYCFWKWNEGQDPDTEKIEDQTISCWFATGIYLDFDYNEVKGMLSDSDFRNYTKRLYPPASEDDITMLRVILNKWVQDVDTDFYYKDEFK